MQFLIQAYDGTDEGALDRRMGARAEHLANLETYKTTRNVHHAVAILNDDGNMVGTNMVVEFSSHEELNNWLSTEPYVLQNVWEDIQVCPCKISPSFE